LKMPWNSRKQDKGKGKITTKRTMMYEWNLQIQMQIATRKPII